MEIQKMWKRQCHFEVEGESWKTSPHLQTYYKATVTKRCGRRWGQTHRWMECVQRWRTKPLRCIHWFLTKMSRQVTRKKTVFPTNDAGEICYTEAKTLTWILQPHVKMFNSTWVLDPNLRAKTTKFLEEK
jgi:hypothetical protein